VSPCKCRPACGPHFGAAIAALGGAGGIPMRGSAAGRRRSPQPGRAAHRSMGDERERVRYMRRCGPRGADRRGGRGCVPGQPAGLREVVRGAPLRQGRPKGAGEPQAPVGCRGYPHARLCRWATVVAAAAEAAHRSSVMSGSEWTRAEMRPDRRPVVGKACGGSQAGAVAPEGGSARVCPSLRRCVNRRC